MMLDLFPQIRVALVFPFGEARGTKTFIDAALVRELRVLVYSTDGKRKELRNGDRFG